MIGFKKAVATTFGSVIGLILAICFVIFSLSAVSWIGGVYQLRFGDIRADLVMTCQIVRDREADLNALYLEIAQADRESSYDNEMARLDEQWGHAHSIRYREVAWYNARVTQYHPLQLWAAGVPAPLSEQYEAPEQPFTPCPT